MKSQHVILTLSANPACGHRLALDREACEIERELTRCTHRECFELVTRWAAEPLDLLENLRRFRPTVVHFSGHGAQDISEPESSPLSRDVIGEPRLPGCRSGGLCFQRPDGHVEIVSCAALKDTFRAVGSSVTLVVLNACYTERQAMALCTLVDCVIGTRGAINDEAAIMFAKGLYGGIGEGASIGEAFQHGRAAISLKGLRERDRPQLKVRAGVDARQIVLVKSCRRYLRRPTGR